MRVIKPFVSQKQECEACGREVEVNEMITTHNAPTMNPDFGPLAEWDVKYCIDCHVQAISRNYWTSSVKHSVCIPKSQKEKAIVNADSAVDFLVAIGRLMDKDEYGLLPRNRRCFIAAPSNQIDIAFVMTEKWTYIAKKKGLMSEILVLLASDHENETDFRTMVAEKNGMGYIISEWDSCGGLSYSHNSMSVRITPR